MNRVKQASDALWAAVQAAFSATADVQPFRNPKGVQAWARSQCAIVLQDDKDPEILRTLSGPIYDLQLEPEILIARQCGEDERGEVEWDDVERLKAALDQDLSLGGAVEDVRVTGVEGADLDEDQWIGGGLAVRVRLLFAAPTPAG